MWIPVSERQTEGLATCCGHSVKPISLSRLSPPWEAVRMELLLYFCWCHTLSVTQKQNLKSSGSTGWSLRTPCMKDTMTVCVCVWERNRGKEERRRECVYCTSQHLKSEHRARCPEFNLNCSAPWDVTWVHSGRWGGLSVHDVLTLWLCLSASGLSHSLQSGRFATDITAASVSPVSLGAPGCPSHCGAFSRAGARLCCSASTRGNACSHPWAAWAGGNLWTKQRCHWQEFKSWNLRLYLINADTYRDGHQEIICTPIMFFLKIQLS